MGRSNGSSDPLVVRTSELATVLRQWIDGHDDLHPRSDGRNVTDRVPHTSGIRYLAEESGTAQGVIYKILKGDTKYTSLDVADRLLQAAELPHEMHSLAVAPNPQWGQERWVEYMRERGCEP